MWVSYLINLKANTDRLANCARQFDAAGIPWTRVDGVNGWAMTDEEVARVYSATRNAKDGKHPLVKPEIGCYLSHIEAWRQIAEGTEPGGFIFEDDFQADASLRPAIERLSVADADWDMVKLFSFDPEPKMLSRRPLGDGLVIGEPYRVPTCLIGYGVTRKAARRLVDTSIPFFRPVDEDMKYFWEKELRMALVLPPPIIVGDQAAQTGTIGDARRAKAAERRQSTGSAPLHKLIYQLKYAVQLHYHRLWRPKR